MFDLTMSKDEEEKSRSYKRASSSPISLGPRKSLTPSIRNTSSRYQPTVPTTHTPGATFLDKVKAGDIKGLIGGNRPISQQQPNIIDQLARFDFKGLASNPTVKKLGVGLSHGLDDYGMLKPNLGFDSNLANSKDSATASFGKQQIQKEQERQDYLKAHPVEGIAGMIGQQIPSLPLWITGERAVGALGKGIGKFSPSLASTAEKVASRAPSFVRGGLKDAMTYGGIVSPVENIAQGGDLQSLLDKEKQLPSIALGGAAVRGVIPLIGKGISKAVTPADRLGPLNQSLDDAVRSVYKRPPISNAKANITPEQIAHNTRQTELSNVFDNAPIGSVDTPMTRNTLQGNIDNKLGIGKPTGGYEGLNAFPKPLRSFKRSTDTQDAVAEITKKMTNQANGVTKTLRQMDKDTPIETTRSKIQKMGGIRPSKGDLFEEQQVIPAWIKNANGRPLDEVADTLGMSSEELRVVIGSEAFKPKDYAAETFKTLRTDKDYQALSGTLDTLKGQLPGKKTLDAMPSLKPRELTPKPAIETTPISEPFKRNTLSGYIPKETAPIKPERLTWDNASKISQEPFRGMRAKPITMDAPVTQFPKEVQSAVDAPIGKPKVQTGKATWQNADVDQPVEVTGYAGNYNGVDYVNVKGSNSGVPLKDIRYDAPIGPAREVAAVMERNAVPSISVRPANNLPGGTKTIGAEPEIPGGMKERGVSENIRTDVNRPDELRDSFSVDPLVYKQLGNKETLAKAQSIFNQGFDTARKQVDELLAKGQPEAAPLTKMLADKLTNEGDIVGARDLLSNAATRATEAGQFGQAFRILREADPATFMMTFDKQLAKLNKEGLEQYGKKWKPVDLTPDELTMIGKIEKGNQSSYDSAFEQIQARIADEMPSALWEKVTAWRHIAMLLNTTTNIRNISGNAIMMAMRKVAQRTEGVLQKAVSKADRNQVVFVNKEYKRLATDYVKANENDLLSGANKYQDNVSLSMPNKRVFAKSRVGEKLGMNIDVLEKTRKFNYALLQKGDDPFFKNAYSDRLASYAQAKGEKDFSKLGQEAFDMAKKDALESTYKNANFIADFLNNAKRPGKDASLFRKGIAAATEIAIPFVKTPLNIMARGAEYTPLSLITGFGRMASKKSAMAGISDMAKGMVGSGIVGLGYTLASGGILTGGSSKDKDLREYNNATGNAPFSVMGKYSFDWALPISIPLIIGVELYNSTHKSEDEKNKMDGIISGNDDAKLSEKIMNVLGGISDGVGSSVEATMNMSMLQTVKSLLFNQQGYLEGLKDLPKDFVTQLMPSMVGKFASSVDPIVRTQYVKGDRVTSLKNSVISKVPFASKTLQPKLTPFGGETKRIENPIGRTLGQFLSPGIIAKNQGIIPKIDTELKRLNTKGGLTTQFPTMTPNYIDGTQTHPRITLTPTETTQYQKRVGELTLNSFQKVMNSSSYLHPAITKLKSPDEVKAGILANAISDAKAITKKEVLKTRGMK